MNACGRDSSSKRDHQARERATAFGHTPLEAHERVRKGIAIREVLRFVDDLGLTQQETALLGLPLRMELLATDPGAEAVEDLLGRIEYGVIS